MKDRPRTQDWDWPLLGIIGAISTLGVLEVYSSTHASAMAGMHWKQLMWIGIGLVGMFLISRIDYHLLMDQAPVLYMFGLATLPVGFSSVTSWKFSTRAKAITKGSADVRSFFSPTSRGNLARTCAASIWIDSSSSRNIEARLLSQECNSSDRFLIS